MEKAFYCALYLIEYAYEMGKEHALNYLKLRPLLVLAQGFSLALNDKCLFDDDIIKTGYGCNMKFINNKFYRWGGLTLPNPSGLVRGEYSAAGYHYGDWDCLYHQDNLSDESKEILRDVFDNYHEFNLNYLNHIACFDRKYWQDCDYDREIAPLDIKLEFQEIIENSNKTIEETNKSDNYTLDDLFNVCSSLFEQSVSLENVIETVLKIYKK